MNNCIKKHLKRIKKVTLASASKWYLSKVPLRNIIFFESAPDCSDSARVIFDEMISKGWNKRYKMIWAVDHPENFDNWVCANTQFVKKGSAKWRRLSQRSKILLSCNYTFYKTVSRDDQLYIHLGHGCAFKSCGKYVYLPTSMTFFNRMSNYNIEVEAKVTNTPVEKIITLGHARNDIFYKNNSCDPQSIFGSRSFDKLIMWLPTFRQNKTNTRIYSSIALPILHTVQDAIELNEFAKDYKVLIVLKPHFNQSLANIKMYNLSNLIVIDDAFLARKGTSLYPLLAKADALLTDYSSVFQDFLNAGKPIGLCWEDYEEFNEKDGFDIDIGPIKDAGEEILSIKDLMNFISRVSAGEDMKKEKREKLNHLVNPYQDGCSCERMISFIDGWIHKSSIF